jgi:GMP synthase-like glutamine amidotransferase
MFHPLLVEAARRTTPHITIESTEFDVVMGEYPESLDDFDALLVTGSASSSYDDAEWIRKLGQYLKEVYQSNPRIRIFGSCFGHQILSDYLLDGYGAKVEKDPNGWEIGVHEIKLNEEFRQLFGSEAQLGLERASTPEAASTAEVPSSLRLQFVHADHVRLDPAKQMPKSWVSMGTTEHCSVQGFCQPGRVLTFQGHFEFDRFVNTEVLKVFGASWEEARREKALQQIDADDDAAAAAELVLKFFVGQGNYGGNGLDTPPVIA